MDRRATTPAPADQIGKISSKMRRKFALIIVTVPLGLSLIYWQSIIVFISCLFFDRCYQIRGQCTDGVCYSIVNESILLPNSYVRTYFFGSDLFPIPAINKNYVYFDDDVSLCVIHDKSGSFELIASNVATLNNIQSFVAVTHMDSVGLPCTPDVR